MRWLLRKGQAFFPFPFPPPPACLDLCNQIVLVRPRLFQSHAFWYSPKAVLLFGKISKYAVKNMLKMHMKSWTSLLPLTFRHANGAHADRGGSLWGVQMRFGVGLWSGGWILAAKVHAGFYPWCSDVPGPLPLLMPQNSLCGSMETHWQPGSLPRTLKRFLLTFHWKITHCTTAWLHGRRREGAAVGCGSLHVQPTWWFHSLFASPILPPLLWDPPAALLSPHPSSLLLDDIQHPPPQSWPRGDGIDLPSVLWDLATPAFPGVSELWARL